MGIFNLGDVWCHRFTDRDIQLKIVSIEKMAVHVDVTGGPKDGQKNVLVNKSMLNGVRNAWYNATLEKEIE